LEALGLGSNVSSAAARAMASAGWRRLESLMLLWAKFGDADGRALTRAPWFAGLRSLTLSGAAFEVCNALAFVPAGLRSLAVYDSPQGDGGARDLLRSNVA